MAINFRGRLEGHALTDAGNYENLCMYRPADYKSPALIRLSVTSMRRAAEPTTSFPGWAGL